MTNDSGQSRAYSAAHFMFELDGVDKLGMFRSIEGGGLKAEVMTYQNGGTYDRWRQLGKPKFDDIKLQVGMAMSEPFFKWIAEFFTGKASRKNGAIIAADFDYKERARREFSEAMITELTFPKLDATDKNTAYMNVSIGVENIVFKKGGGAQIQQLEGDRNQKGWKACNFKFSIDGFADPCKRVTKIDSFTVKQNIVEYASGGRRTVAKIPSAIDFPQVSFYLPEADAQPLLDHVKKRIVDGEVPGRLNGRLETFDNSGPDNGVRFSLDLLNLDILNVQPDKADSTTEEIKQVKVDMYVESMKFSYVQTQE